MLAEERSPASTGSLDDDLHETGTFLHKVIDFIADHLSVWRDDLRRSPQSGEVRLSDQLVRYLNRAARRSKMDVITFLPETPDELRGDRKIDITAAPSDRTIWIGAREYSFYDILLPIECKRLPTPSDREKREYLHTFKGRTGGVQRFRDSLHGGNHDLAAIIGFVQHANGPWWHSKLQRWVAAFIRARVARWSAAEAPGRMRWHEPGVVLRFSSSHPRSGRTPIALEHLLVEM